MISKETRKIGEGILREGWSHIANDPRSTAKLRPEFFAFVMTQMQLDLLRCYLPEMDRKTSERACHTILELEEKLT
jgi:hypothetical protein